jgi:hypothetical protein
MYTLILDKYIPPFFYFIRAWFFMDCMVRLNLDIDQPINIRSPVQCRKCKNARRLRMQDTKYHTKGYKKKKKVKDVSDRKCTNICSKVVQNKTKKWGYLGDAKCNYMRLGLESMSWRTGIYISDHWVFLAVDCLSKRKNNGLVEFSERRTRRHWVHGLSFCVHGIEQTNTSVRIRSSI